jgi:hypothetical protein
MAHLHLIWLRIELKQAFALSAIMGGTKSGKAGFAMGSCSALEDTISRVGRQEDVAHVDPIPPHQLGDAYLLCGP